MTTNHAEAVRTDEIDFKLPATQKCIYYVNLAANNRSNSYFSALFFDTLMSELESVARKSGGRCPIKIKLYMDEYYNLGIIPNMDNRLGTLRSAGIDIYLYLQSLGQLMQMYPEQQWEIVMECVSMVCLLKTNTNTTAEYVSKMCGVMTAKTRGIRRTKTKGTLGLGFEVMENISNTQRNVYFPDELRRMDNKELLVIPSGHNPFRFRKVLYISHPMMKLVRQYSHRSIFQTGYQNLIQQTMKNMESMKTRRLIMENISGINLLNRLMKKRILMNLGVKIKKKTAKRNQKGKAGNRKGTGRRTGRI